MEYNFFGQHVEPALLLFVPAYWLGAGPLFLMAAQNVIAVSAAVPLFYAARRWGVAQWGALALAAAFLANPYLHRQLDFDFHTEVMIALPAFAAAWAISAGRPRLAVGLALSTLLLKEDAALVALALGALLWWRGCRRPGLVVAGVAVTYAVVAVLVIMPLARDGAPSDIVERYGYLVDTQSQANLLPDLLKQPWVIPQQLLKPEQLWTAALLLAISAPLAVLRPWTLLLVAPAMGLALLATHPAQKALELHYSAGIIPIAVLANMAGLARVSGARRRLLPGATLAAALVGFVFLSPIAPWNAEGTPPTEKHRAAVAEALALVPGDEEVSVSAQSGLLSRLSQRRDAFEFPNRAEEADWIVVDQYGFRSSQSLDAGFDAELGELTQTHQRVFDKDGVQVFRRLE